MNIEDLKKPFAAEDIEWRVQSAGKNKEGKVWAQVLAYVTNRAIMDRLDAVVGPENWTNQFVTGPGGGVVCGLSLRINDEWITKWDGADNPDFEPVKGGLSNSMKRAAVHWGIGRYLYDLDVGWADVREDGKIRSRLPEKLGGDPFRWDPPMLPAWARPEGSEEKPAPRASNGKTNGKAKPASPPGEEISRVAQIEAAIANIHTAQQADRYEKRIDEMAQAGELSVEEVKKLKGFLQKTRDAVLGAKV